MNPRHPRPEATARPRQSAAEASRATPGVEASASEPSTFSVPIGPSGRGSGERPNDKALRSLLRQRSTIRNSASEDAARSAARRADTSAELNSVIADSDLATVVIDLDGRIVSANLPFAELLDPTSLHAQPGQLVSAVVDVAAIGRVGLPGSWESTDPTPSRRFVEALLEDPQCGRVLETRLHRGHGSEIPVLLSYRVRTDTSGEPAHVICELRTLHEHEADIDVRSRFEELADDDFRVRQQRTRDAIRRTADISRLSELARTAEHARHASVGGGSLVGTSSRLDLDAYAGMSEDARDRDLRELIELLPTGLVIVDNDAQVLLYNRAALALLATHADDLVNGRFPHPFTVDSAYDLDLRDSNGRLRTVEVRSVPIDWEGRLAHLVSLHDETERSQKERTLERSFFHDALTSLPGRELFLNRVHEMIRSTSPETDTPFAIVMVDLDQFRQINDAIGSEGGDRVLQSVATRLTNAVRPNDYVARLGGDDFAILLSADDIREHLIVANRVLDLLSKPFEVDGNAVHCSATVALASWRESEDEYEVLAAAQMAVMDSRARNLGSVAVRDDASAAAHAQMARLSDFLPVAVQQGQLFLHYQPVFDLDNGTIASLEALVRWEHPEDGLITPGEFIRIADETGAIISLGEWVMGEVADQIIEWRNRRPDAVIPPVGINITSRQLLHPGFRDHAVAILHGRGVEPSAIRFEITEKILVERSKRVDQILEQLAADGFSIDLDDFGTGLSSITQLQEFPIASIKIDRIFVNHILDDDAARRRVEASILVAHTFGVKVVAEGVETADQKALLYRWGCDQAQGYLLARPLTPLEASRFFVRNGPEAMPLNRQHGLLRRGVSATSEAW